MIGRASDTDPFANAPGTGSARSLMQGPTRNREGHALRSQMPTRSPSPTPRSTPASRCWIPTVSSGRVDVLSSAKSLMTPREVLLHREPVVVCFPGGSYFDA